MAHRISARTKAVVVVLLLVLASLAIVVSFAAGFVIGTMLDKAGRRDVCTGMDGTWDAQNGVCVKPFASGTALATTTETYRCGDGTRFQLTPHGIESVTYQDAATTSRELPNLDPAANIMSYGDGTLTVTLVGGPEARLRDTSDGRDVLCAL